MQRHRILLESVDTFLVTTFPGETNVDGREER